MLFHSGERPNICDQCNKSFIEPSILKKHILTHSDKKPHKCDQCSKLFIEPSKLRRHILTHSDKKPHKCVKCKESFYQVTNLDNRETLARPKFETMNLQEFDEKVKSLMKKSQNKISDGTKRADICKICGNEGQWVTIRDHIEAKHLEGFMLPCNICGNVFKMRSHLRRHRCMDDMHRHCISTI